MGGIKETLKRIFPEPRYTRMRNRRLYAWMNENAPGKKVLNLGSGVGHFDHFLSPDIKMLNTDIDPDKPGVDVVADAHDLPFEDESFDIVYSIAVLEHVRKPWIVAGEITRILKSGGHVVLELPFLNTIHDEHDYFRFTDRGIRSLFDEDAYEEVFSQVGSAGGSFLSVFLLQYLEQFVPTRLLRSAWWFLMRYPLSLLKYLDLPLSDGPLMRITANSFTFIARKK